MPENLWAQRCTLNAVRLAQRQTRPPEFQTRGKVAGIHGVATNVFETLGVAAQPLSAILGVQHVPVASGGGVQDCAGADVDVSVTRDAIAPGSGVRHPVGQT
jgi:hypothetical protein